MGICSTRTFLEERNSSLNSSTSRRKTSKLEKKAVSDVMKRVSSKSKSLRKKPWIEGASLFENFNTVMKFFDIEKSDNILKNVYIITCQLYDVDKLLMRFSRTIFDNYDTNKDGFIDIMEFARFWRDVANLMDMEESDPHLYHESLSEFTELLKVEKVLKISFSLFLESRILEKVIKKYEDIAFFEDEGELDISKTTNRRRLNSGEKKIINCLVSDSILEDFSGLLKFLDIKQTSNLIRDVFRVRESFLKTEDVCFGRVFERFALLIFQYYDLNNDNFLDRKELLEFSKDLYLVLPGNHRESEKKKVSKELADYIIGKFDTNSDNKISIDEIRNCLAQLMEKFSKDK